MLQDGIFSSRYKWKAALQALRIRAGFKIYNSITHIFTFFIGVIWRMLTSSYFNQVFIGYKCLRGICCPGTFGSIPWICQGLLKWRNEFHLTSCIILYSNKACFTNICLGLFLCMSNVLHLMSNVLHLMSNVLHPKCCILSNVLHLSAASVICAASVITLYCQNSSEV